jgi:exodeoxyribonuclease VII large subunit
MRCVMFQRQYRGMPLENGAQVMAHGSVSFYAERGDLQIVVDFVQPAGVGARQAEFERLKEKLAAEGLFDEGRKRPLPAFRRESASSALLPAPSSTTSATCCAAAGRSRRSSWRRRRSRALRPSPASSARSAPSTHSPTST